MPPSSAAERDAFDQHATFDQEPRSASATKGDHPEGPPSKRIRTRQLSISSSLHCLASGALLNAQSPPISDANGVNTGSPQSSGRGPGRHDSGNQALTLPGRALQTSQEDGDKRLLRSHAGTSRVRSELELFFHDYRDLVFGPEQAANPITVDSIFYLGDEKSGLPPTSALLPVRQRATTAVNPISLSKGSQSPDPDAAQRCITPNGGHLYTILDLSRYEDQAHESDEDPLADVLYLQSHARGERRQKKERNIEKERSAHEKEQLQGLYAGLQGPDWLKTMGVSGVTDTEKKAFEPKRDQCITRVKRILAKFEDYKEQEKLLKLRRERAAARAAADEQSLAEEEEESDGDAEAETTRAHLEKDLDESALQLQQEAGLATAAPLKIKLRFNQASVGENWRIRNHTAMPKSPARAKEKAPAKPPDPESPFASFFHKPHERAGALGRHRRGRHAAAFGHPLPELSDVADFVLPESFEADMNARKSSSQSGIM